MRLSLGEKLRSLRQKQNLSVEEVSRRSKIHRIAIYTYEQGKRQPTIDNLRKLADALGCTLGEFHTCRPFQAPLKKTEPVEEPITEDTAPDNNFFDSTTDLSSP